MRADDLDFVLPPDLIAQAPAAQRPAARLLHYRRTDRAIAHRQFADLPSILRPGDLLVFNDARVTPARFTLVKSTGGIVEGLFVRQIATSEWTVMLKNLGPLRPEAALHFAADKSVNVHALRHNEDGTYDIAVSGLESADLLLERLGRMPLPPYIRREKSVDERDAFDRERYQTVYAKAGGSVAAPTAGLHFDEAMLASLRAAGVERAFVTLHVGLGTFKPVEVDALADHTMHVERYSLDHAAVDAINSAKRDGRRVIAVGTTAARVLESQPAGELSPCDGETGIFIYPPYAWKYVDALLTNFHLPRSTLIALVAGFVGLDQQRRMYAEAIAERYRFFSYGDTSFLE
ncbi:MAG: tRNA preQ1(34) S-adenosylmethionine ribosyltransferase-isomerase QueA [Phycisphaerales bacterium]|nr:tRNA preQ1(34) S-adenosylmethionine ribosyltransferase-isomerase QueA [Phycisphaerales bacterium]